MYKVSANHNAPKESYLHFKTSAVKFFNVRRQSVEKCGRQSVEKCGGAGLNFSLTSGLVGHCVTTGRRATLFCFFVRSVLPTQKKRLSSWHLDCDRIHCFSFISRAATANTHRFAKESYLECVCVLRERCLSSPHYSPLLFVCTEASPKDEQISSCRFL